MQGFESRKLESDGSIESTSAGCKDACPACDTDPIRRYSVTNDGEVRTRCYCPGCEAYHWQLVAQTRGHDQVLIADGGTQQRSGGLFEYGAKPATTIWPPRTREDEPVCCPKCKQPVEDSRGPHVVEKPDFVEEAIAEHYDGQLVVYGWECDRHAQEVVLPGYSTPRGNNLEGWTAVRIHFDGRHAARYVATPEREAPLDVIDELRGGDA